MTYKQIDEEVFFDPVLGPVWITYYAAIGESVFE
jgi:hypothetical protein